MTNPKKLVVIFIISLFSASCSTIKNGDSSGGVVGGDSGSGGSNNAELIVGVAALLALGWSAVSRRKNINHISNNDNLLPTFKIENKSASKENLKSAGYVLFLKKSTGTEQNKSRHFTFCTELFNKLSYKSSRGPTASAYRPTIWPIKGFIFSDNTNCDSLLENYDHEFRDEILLEYKFPDGDGPLLVAFNGRYKKGMNKSKENIGVYWDLTKYSPREFGGKISIWYKIMSTEVSDWPELIKRLNEREYRKNTLAYFSSVLSVTDSK